MNKRLKRHFVAVRKGEGKPRTPYYMDVFEILSTKEVIPIGNEDFNTASYKGETSVAYSVLHNEGIVSDKDYDNAHGYYHSAKTNIKITSL